MTSGGSVCNAQRVAVKVCPDLTKATSGALVSRHSMYVYAACVPIR
jgi:hypothetical protein